MHTGKRCRYCSQVSIMVHCNDIAKTKIDSDSSKDFHEAAMSNWWVPLSIQCSAVMTRYILSQIFRKGNPTAGPWGVPFVGPPSGWYSASVPVILYVISYNIGPHYNGARLYNVLCRYIPMIMHKVPALLGSVQVQGDFTHTLQTFCTGTGELIPAINRKWITLIFCGICYNHNKMCAYASWINCIFVFMCDHSVCVGLMLSLQVKWATTQNNISSKNTAGKLEFVENVSYWYHLFRLMEPLHFPPSYLLCRCLVQSQRAQYSGENQFEYTIKLHICSID